MRGHDCDSCRSSIQKDTAADLRLLFRFDSRGIGAFQDRLGQALLTLMPGKGQRYLLSITMQARWRAEHR